MDLKYGIAIATTSAILAGGLVRHFYTETKIVTKDKIITRTRTVINHDGSSVIDQTITEDKRTIETAAAPRPEWRITGGYGIDFRDKSQVYQIGVDKRLIGPLTLGAWGESNGVVGLRVGVEF